MGSNSVPVFGEAVSGPYGQNPNSAAKEQVKCGQAKFLVVRQIKCFQAKCRKCRVAAENADRKSDTVLFANQLSSAEHTAQEADGEASRQVDGQCAPRKYAFH